MRWTMLTSWWNRELLDNATTSDPEWVSGARRPRGYRRIRDEGLVADDLDGSSPRGYTPLLRYHSAERHDHVTTSHPSWRSAREGSYVLSRSEGMALDRPYAGTARLTSWWSDSRAENYTTATGTWHEGAPDIPSEYRFVREEGHLRPASGALPTEDPHRIGYRSHERSGVRDVLVVLCDYSDRRVSRPASFWQSFVAGPSDPHLAGYYRAISGGRFGIRRVQTVRIDLGAEYATASANVGAHDTKVIQLAAREADLDEFGDGNSVVTGDELIVLAVIAGDEAGAQRRVVPSTFTAGRMFDGVTIIGFGDAGDLRLAAHEVMHMLAADQHNYGPRYALNQRASLFASGGRFGTASAGPVDLDPWNKLLLGWVKPRLVPITRAGGVAMLHAAQLCHLPQAIEQGPLAFYDPRRGTDELLIVEYRCPNPRGAPSDGIYDSLVVDQGIAVWYVKRWPDGAPRAGLAVDFVWPTETVTTSSGSSSVRVLYDRPLDVTTRRANNAVANFLIGPDLYGAAPFWTHRDGEMRLRWADATDTGLRMRIGELSDGQPSAVVTWWHASQPFLPRLDRCMPNSVPAGADRTLAIDGMFPPGDTIQLRFRPPSDSGRGAVVGQAQVSGIGSRVLVRIDVPEATGVVHASVHRSDGSASNEIPVAIA